MTKVYVIETQDEGSPQRFVTQNKSLFARLKAVENDDDTLASEWYEVSEDKSLSKGIWGNKDLQKYLTENDFEVADEIKIWLY